MTFTPSVHQQKIFDFVANGRGSAVVIAVAGSGKTTTVMKSLAFIPENNQWGRSTSVQLFAFNAEIAKELKSRLVALGLELARPFKGFRAGTFHSVGYGALLKFLNRSADQLKPDGSKSSKLCRGWLGEYEMDLYGSYISKLVGFAKGEGIGALVPNTDDRWYDLIQHHDLYLETEEATETRALELAKELLNRSNAAAKEGNIDFDDMLYLPLLWKLRLWQNDWVFIDEAQDTNPVRRAIAKLALRPGGRLIAVGDPKQAIYGFTGASHDAIELIKREFSATELPLTISYRCPKVIGAKVRELVPYFEVHENAVEGTEQILSLKEALGLLTDHDVILCRNIAPLITTAYQIIASGRGCGVLGKDIGEGLVSLVKKMRAKSLSSLVEKLSIWREREVAKWTAKGEEGKAEMVNDKAECLDIVIEHLSENDRTIPKLLSKIEGMFKDGNGTLTLSTAHKAKGREWRQVAILRPDLMPSKWARQDWQQAQERNLMYVAWTRVQHSLIFIEGEK
jgi:DNA helicase II / ATP-dependent DNA helicase PcrA